MSAGAEAPRVLAVFGPTASGKNAVAEALARRIPAEIVSADAMQAYRGLPILTNQPERPTRLVAIWPLDHEGSVGEYQQLAHAAIDEVLAAGRTPVVTGGTGLYLRAALGELALPPAPPPGARERWEAFYDRAGGERAHAELAELDPEAAAAVHANDRRRVVRALELADAGTSLRPASDRLWAAETRHPTFIAGLEVAPETLAARIERRTRAMFERGVVEEVGLALEGPLSATARRAIGLEEVATLPPEGAIAAIALRTRQYAAYQRKWLRRIPGAVSVPADRPPDAVADAILEMARIGQRLPARGAG
ncbi:MAG TPA: tRNA (adenosine(37)-N6)-dimethylallyltransferase MiaA [Gaiellaceae bacterium]|nr:tRNA (adenosine(37)-N6)-dimethylallyltransferase MiaA [Gaiellaceae bacterium]